MLEYIPSDYQKYLFHHGDLFKSYEMLGAHITKEDGVSGVRFSVWAPNALKICVIGDFNHWQGSDFEMEKLNDEGIWSLFISGLEEGTLYKYQIHVNDGRVFEKADPYAFYSELRPKSASIVYNLNSYQWKDKKWLTDRIGNIYSKPTNIYEVHLGSWKLKEDESFYTYRELVEELIPYVKEMGYTHIQLLPLGEHPFDGSWGYQTTGYYSVTSRYGNPSDFMYFVDCCHQNNIGVILDWVPAHFCKDGHGLIQFDGTELYGKGEFLGWGTMQFDYGRPEVICFLISNAIFWFDIFHIDGIRVDAVASMLYLDYERKGQEGTRNKYGGNGNLEAIALIKRMNEVVFEMFPDVLMIAEESTEWPLVTRPTDSGGLGFNYKWNMGWMNDVLKYMKTDCFFRKWDHNLLTFSFLYAFSENFILPMSHDEVVHGKRSLIDKMPGDYWQKFANLRTFMGYMMAHPGKKLLFMGGEIAQFIEWRYYEGIEWHLLDFPMHRLFQRYIKELNHFYLNEKSLWEQDHGWEGFNWIDCDNNEQSIIIFFRKSKATDDYLVIVCNFTPQYYERFRFGVPQKGYYEEVLNSDYAMFGGSDKKNSGPFLSENKQWHNQPYSIEVKIPPLACVFWKKKKEQIKNKAIGNK